jgi:hypothetical protein
MTDFMRNEHGLWCPSCGELLAGPGGTDEEGLEPDECRVCGFPDNIEKMADYHCGDDEDDGPACRVCGCTQNNACFPSCHWVEDDLCSACVDCDVDEAAD